jgi:oligosaccharyltransferase complex subunit beta
LLSRSSNHTSSFSLHHTVFRARNTADSKAVLGSFNGKSEQNPILYKGISHSIGEENVLGMGILTGNPTSYSYFPNKAMKEGPFSAGARSLLVSGIQGRNNARILIAGSIEMFSNQYFSTNNSGNRQFVESISRWVLCESGVLRFRDITHNKLDGTPPDVILHEKERPDLPVTLYPDPEITRNSLVYRIKDDIVYSMIVEVLENNEWKPFHANDMQMEFVMLDPHIRKTMTADDRGKFSATFTAPDNYGIFKFRVFYRRLGYSVLHAETQVSIRPFKHNEYERFILSAYPYYSSAFSAMFALFVLSVFFLFSKDKTEKQD